MRKHKKYNTGTEWYRNLKRKWQRQENKNKEKITTG